MKSLSHAGVLHTLSQLHKQYWILQGRAMVKKVPCHCLICRKYEGGPFTLPEMSPWHRERVFKATPFTYTGFDYLIFQNVSMNLREWISNSEDYLSNIPQRKECQNFGMCWNTCSD